MPRTRIKVVHILQTAGIGGMEGRIARLARGLDPGLYDISILTLRPTSGRVVPLPAAIVPELVPVPSGLHPRALWALSRRIRKGGFQIVHTHNWASMFYGVLAGRLAGAPVVIHGEHGLNFGDVAGVSPKRLAAQRFLASLCGSVVTVNQAMADSVERTWKVPRGKIANIPNGADLQRFRPAAGRIAGGPFVIGAVGRLDKVKDLFCLINGFAMLRRRYVDHPMRLALVGHGPEAEALKSECARLGIVDVVDFAGDCPAPEEWYARFSAFANTSVSEGMSNTLLEAMACGLPLAASGIEGNRSWLREDENALFFPAGDAEALCGRLEALMLRPGLAEGMADRNRKRAEAEFDNRFFLEKYTALYRSLLRP